MQNAINILKLEQAKINVSLAERKLELSSNPDSVKNQLADKQYTNGVLLANEIEEAIECLQNELHG